MGRGSSLRLVIVIVSASGGHREGDCRGRGGGVDEGIFGWCVVGLGR